MPWNPGVQYRGDQYAYQGITNAGNILSDSLVKTLQKLDEQRKTQAFGDSVIEHLSQTKDQSGQPYVPAEQLLKYHQGSSSQKQGIVQGALANATFDAQRQAAQQKQALEQAQIGYYGAHGDYMRAQAAAAGAPGADTLNLTPEEMDAANRAGKIPLRSSQKSFQYADMPEAPDPPDLDAQGNPIYTNDGTMYRSGGKFKPVTAPMMQAKMAWDAMKKANPNAAAGAAKQSGFSPFDSSTWFGGSAAPSPAPTLPSGPTGPTPGAPDLMPQQPTQGQPNVAKSKADWDALPSGSLYTAPDGSVRRKP
jgi:hypothetical protein